MDEDLTETPYDINPLHINIRMNILHTKETSFKIY